MVTTGAQSAPPVATKCPLAAQRKQAKRASILLFISIEIETVLNSLHLLTHAQLLISELIPDNFQIFSKDSKILIDVFEGF